MARHLHNIALVATTTFGSRILGLLRDGLMIALLGTSPEASAFLFAFTVPNLFRRLLGEGALTSAFIPVFSEALQKDGRTVAFQFARKVLSWALAVLAVLTLLGVLAYLLAGWAIRHFMPAQDPDSLRWFLGVDWGVALLPYMPFVCLAALMGAMLNVLQRFAIHALSSVWLNLSMIGALLISGLALHGSPSQVGIWLIGGVLFGGLLQILIPTVALRQVGFRGRLDYDLEPRLGELQTLFLPALGGAAIMQINVLVSRIFGFGLNDQALPALYLAGRLIELPLGVFAIAIATVLFPQLSLQAAAGEARQLEKTIAHGLRMVLAITLPAAVGLAVLSGPILRLLFEWGRFDARDISITQPVLLIFALALPCYGMASFVTRAYHARKDMRTPVRVAWWAFGLNLAGCALLVYPLGVIGLALANLLSALAQAGLLISWQPGQRPQGVAKGTWQIALASCGMALLCLGGLYGLGLLLGPGKLADAASLLFLIPAGMGVYFGLLWCLRFEERDAALGLVRSILKRR